VPDHEPRARGTASPKFRSVTVRCDQGREPTEGADEKRWGNRLNWMKKWGNRVGRMSYSDGMGSSWSKRWGSRVCLQAHCGSLANNRHAYVACGQSYCGKRRR